jgi:hypothetical protein
MRAGRATEKAMYVLIWNQGVPGDESSRGPERNVVDKSGAREQEEPESFSHHWRQSYPSPCGVHYNSKQRDFLRFARLSPVFFFSSLCSIVFFFHLCLLVFIVVVLLLLYDIRHKASGSRHVYRLQTQQYFTFGGADKTQHINIPSHASQSHPFFSLPHTDSLTQLLQPYTKIWTWISCLRSNEPCAVIAGPHTPGFYKWIAKKA